MNFPKGKNSNLISPTWLLGDHLGSTSMVADETGEMVSEVRYSAFGEIRYDSGNMTTDYLYTGQRQEAEIGLYYYVARWYDPANGRFMQADSVVPYPGSAKGFDRFAYVGNNPLRYIDPSGHVLEGACGFGGGDCGSTIGFSNSQWTAPSNPNPQPYTPWQSNNIWPDDEYLFGKEPADFFMSNEEIFLAGFQSPIDDPYNFGGYGAKNTLGGPGYHPGLDSRTDYGPPETTTVNWTRRPINSVYDGFVTNTTMIGGFGNFVVVEHIVYGTKFYSVYAHLDSVDVNVGDWVNSGTKVGEMGNSGTSDPHLHFEVRRENNISTDEQNPFSGHVWWPVSFTEHLDNFVDLGQLPYVNNEGFGQ